MKRCSSLTRWTLVGLALGRGGWCGRRDVGDRRRAGRRGRRSDHDDRGRDRRRRQRGPPRCNAPDSATPSSPAPASERDERDGQRPALALGDREGRLVRHRGAFEDRHTRSRRAPPGVRRRLRLLAGHRQQRALVLEQAALAVQAAGVAGQRAARADDAMAGDDQRQRVAAVGGADRAGGAGRVRAPPRSRRRSWSCRRGSRRRGPTRGARRRRRSAGAAAGRTPSRTPSA